jgi:hypothetical protein
LGPEEDVTFEALQAAAEAVPQVLAAAVEWGDFRVLLNGVVQPTLIDKKKIDVQPLQRAFAQFLAITGGTEKVTINLQSLVINMATGTPVANQNEVKLAVSNAFNNALAGFKAGDDIVFASFKGSLENLVMGSPYTIATLGIQAVSEADTRTQTASIPSPVDIHIRTVELATVTPILPTNITLNLI